MVYRGRVKNGAVMLTDDIHLPEGAEVRVELLEDERGTSTDEEGQTLGQKLLKFAGKATELPADAARNHDHYLYGTPKQ